MSERAHITQILSYKTNDDLAELSGIPLPVIESIAKGQYWPSFAEFTHLADAAGLSLHLYPKQLHPFAIVPLDNMPEGATHFNATYATGFEKWVNGQGYAFVFGDWYKMESPRTGTVPILSAQTSCQDASKLEQITTAIKRYYLGLEQRKNGNMAVFNAFDEIQNILGMQWKQGKESRNQQKEKV